MVKYFFNFSVGLFIGLIGLFLWTQEQYLMTLDQPVQIVTVPHYIYQAEDYDCKQDAECLKLAEAIYHEARSEPYIGQKAVAHVILNRKFSPKFPDTIVDVVEFRCHFAYRCDGSLERGFAEDGAYQKALTVAEKVITFQTVDPTNGADHYVAPKALTFIPNWTMIYPEVAQIHDHVFYRWE